MAVETFFGDPTLVGCLTTMGYLVGAGLCGAAGCRKEGRAAAGGSWGWFWWGMAGLLLLLGVNKQLDMQSWLIESGRQLSRRLGWYGERRLIQAVSMILLTLGITFGLVLFYRKTRAACWEHPGAFLGGLMLLGFVLLRAFTFSHVLESFLDRPVPDFLNHALEDGALVVIGFSAWRAMRRGANAGGVLGGGG